MFSRMARMALRDPVSSFDREMLHKPADKPPDPPPGREFLIGLSVGQGLQPTGIAVLERLLPEPPRTRRRYACRYLRRWCPPATSYPTLVSNLTDMLSGTPLRNSDLVVEAGPGINAVVAFLRKHRLPARIQPVEVKAGAEDGYVEGIWRIAKAGVIETTRQVLQEDRLIFDDRMPPEVMTTTPSAQTIYHGLSAYPYNKMRAANDAFASREGADDDLILAVALACWFGECCRRTLWVR
jgi:hypothetical protein